MIPMHNEAFVKGFMRYWESYLNGSTEIWQKLAGRHDRYEMNSQIQRYDSWNELFFTTDFKSIVSFRIV